MDSPSRKAWRIQEWRSGFRAGPVARSHDYNNKSSKKNGAGVLLYAQNLLHSLYKMGELRICGQELSVAIFGHNSQKCGSVRCRSGKSKGVASSLWLQSQHRYSSRLVIRPCYNTSQLNASTREPREN